MPSDGSRAGRRRRGWWIGGAVVLGLAGWYLWAATDWSPPDLADERAIAEQMAQIEAARVVTIDERRPPRVDLDPLVVCCSDGSNAYGSVVVTYEGGGLDDIEAAVEARLRSQGWERGDIGWWDPRSQASHWGTLTRDVAAGEVRLRIGRIEG